MKKWMNERRDAEIAEKGKGENSLYFLFLLGVSAFI